MGDVWAQCTLGTLYESKRDCPEDRVLAVPWFRMAAEQSHPESLFHLAELFHWGEVVPRDDAEAARLYRKAFEVDAAVFRNLGFPTTWEWSEQDLAEGLSWFGKFAEQGEPWAQEILAGLMVKSG